MKFGRRMSFNSQIRMDIIYAHGSDASETQESQPMRGEVTVPGKEPFTIKIPSSAIFPVNLMVTHMDESNDCLAFWSCANLGPSLSQKGAWIMCKSTDVDKEIVEDLTQKVSEVSNIDPEQFVWTNYEQCP
ncbi:hypothetical protein JTE90_020878 [Oedothorax gibbosus]|nr:hypothetical protein JTE90_020878 [Oedothorax gibbosus]